MFLPSTDGSTMSLPALRELYLDYVLTVRCVCAETAISRIRYLNALFVFLGETLTSSELFSELSPVTLTEFLLDYATEHGHGSRKAMHTAVRSFLRFLYVEQFLERDLSDLVPTVRLRRLTELPRALPDLCICKLEESINRSSPAGRRDAAIICLLSTYGVRGAQIRRLCLDHIDWQNDRIHFPAAKSGRSIEQHLTVKAGNRLADYISEARPSSVLPEVFLTITAATLTSNTLSRVIRRRLLRAKVHVPEGVSHGSHGFRHAFAVRMTGQIPFKDVVDMLGHRDPASTLIYAKVDVQTLQQAALPWPGVSS